MWSRPHLFIFFDTGINNVIYIQHTAHYSLIKIKRTNNNIIMTDMVVRFQSRQGGPFRSDQQPGLNNLVDFDIPDDAVWDLDNSWVNLYASVDTTTTGNLTGVHNVRLRYNATAGGADTERSWYNVALVDNAHMTASNAGRLEDIRRVGILRQNLKEYTLSQSQKDGERFRSGRQNPDRTQLATSVVRELNKEGDIESQNVDAQLQIPLRDIFSLGSLSEYHANKWGKTRVHLELNTGLIQAFELTAAAARQNADQYDFDNFNGADIDSLDTTSTYTRLEDSPYWVGQVLTITTTGGTVFSTDAKITNIVWNRTGANAGKLTLSLDWDGATPVGPSTGITADPVVASDVTTLFNQAELVLQKVRNPGPAPDKLNYRTWTTEEFTGTGQTNFSRMFQLEPEAVNVFLMFPTNKVISQNNDLETYRLRLNNEDLIDRDVNPAFTGTTGADPLHLDRLNMTFLNSGMPMVNFQQYNYNQNQKTLAAQTQGSVDNQLTLIGNPVPFTNREKNLQVNLSLSNNGLQRLNLYKQVVRAV